RTLWSQATGYRMVFSVSSDQLQTEGSLRLYASVSPLLANVSPLLTNGSPIDPDPYNVADTHLWLNSDLFGVVPPAQEDAALLQREWGKDPVFGPAKTFRPETRPRNDLFGPI